MPYGANALYARAGTRCWERLSRSRSRSRLSTLSTKARAMWDTTPHGLSPSGRAGHQSGSHAVWDTIACGPPCRFGYHTVWISPRRAGRRYVQVLLQRRHRRAAAETDRPVIQAGTFAMPIERARVVALQAGHLAASTRRACASHPSRSQACCMSCYRARCMSCRPASAHVSVIRHAVRRMTRVRYSMRRRAHAFIVRCANQRPSRALLHSPRCM
jgi:hypothetical protein